MKTSYAVKKNVEKKKMVVSLEELEGAKYDTQSRRADSCHAT